MTITSLDLQSFLEILAQESVTPNDEIFAYLSNTNISRLKEWMVRLKKVRDFSIPRNKKTPQKKTQKNRLLGKILEEAVRVLLDGCRCLQHDGNLRTTTSEIDFLLRIETLGLAVTILRDVGPHVIGEAKCYSSAPRTEWVNEFIGILQSHGARLGYLFTACPPRNLRSEIRTAIAIHAGAGKQVVPFGLTQFERILNGENFLKVLSEQTVLAKVHAASLSV